jgi:DNA helicase-2/ATP-dependent DNA helicase PcrA
MHQPHTPSISFYDFLTTQLNEEQKKAVTHSRGSILVIAGAGSGKTRVITARIAQLIIEEKVHPTAIIALTFTNKAAKEMQERVRSFLGSQATLPFIGTFHAYCVRLLKANNHLLKDPFLSIMDDEDQQKILSALIKKYSCSAFITAKKALYYISQYKHKLHHDQGHENPLLMQLFEGYEREKRASKCLDFDDLLLETLKLIEANPSLKASLHTNIRHILVDEYQDTNSVQHALLQQLTLKNDGNLAVDSLCVVGDEDQSIYAWRGATVDNIINFRRDFPDTTIINI